MSTISIKDLPENTDLDREAMRAITGGARLSGRQSSPTRPILRTARIVDYGPASPPVQQPLSGRRN